MKKWEVLNQEIRFECMPFKVIEEKYQKPNNAGKMNAYILDAPNWVNIIGINNHNEMILIEQFRFGTKNIECEIPGGVIEKGEDPLLGAKREFEEETGYITEDKNWHSLGVVDANPAILTNKCYTFLAYDIKPKGTINFDPDEIIEHNFYPLDEVKRKIENGEISNAYIIAAFFWLEKKKINDISLIN